ncbi:MAG: hypothetical protein KBC42_01810 [Candidatus Pacebacteria bacterium]|nr:hypothetical protein [Candidatus Paceibacterota bacterium]MBP9780639.1 hypothetical protein [Candidatus Paceibacterota bacterium]
MNTNFESSPTPIENKYLPIKEAVEIFLSMKEYDEPKAKKYLEGVIAVSEQDKNYESKSEILREFYLEHYPEN